MLIKLSTKLAQMSSNSLVTPHGTKQPSQLPHNKLMMGAADECHLGIIIKMLRKHLPLCQTYAKQRALFWSTPAPLEDKLDGDAFTTAS